MPCYSLHDLKKGIVQECHAQFSRLPKHGKPSKKSNGQAEWTILAGIVATTPTTLAPGQSTESDAGDAVESYMVECISLGAGSKCLPQGKLSPRGDLVNDCHAEILARRGFNKWCLQEMHSSFQHPENTLNKFRCLGRQVSSPEGKLGPLFALVDPRTQFHLYVSQAPCGDATTASLAHTQSVESRAAFLQGQGQQRAQQQQAATTSGTDDGVQRKSQEQTSLLAGSKHPRQDSDGDEPARSCLTKHPKVRGSSDAPTTISTIAIATDTTTSATATVTSATATVTSATANASTTTVTNDATNPSECNHTLGFRRGRVDYDSVGVLRTKPGRVDSEPTLSMSCSDKIARWGVQGLTSALVAAFLETPIYLSSVITRELFDAAALKRALLERIVVANCACLEKTQLSDGSGHLWRPHPVQIHASSIVFEFSKEAITSSVEQEGGSHQPVASSSSISWIASEPSITEVLVNGCKAGASSKQPLPPKSRSRLCKVNMFQSSVALWKSICAASASTTLEPQVPNLIQCMVGTLAVGQQWPTSKEEITYREWKQLAKDYTAVKEDLFRSVFQNWVRGDEAFEQFNVEGTSLIITRL